MKTLEYRSFSRIYILQEEACMREITRSDVNNEWAHSGIVKLEILFTSVIV